MEYCIVCIIVGGAIVFLIIWVVTVACNMKKWTRYQPPPNFDKDEE